MKFCIKCDNMCYISIDKNDPNVINYYCRVCGHIDNAVDELCILNTKYNSNNSSININTINEFTKLDPTLPHLYNIDCINPECKCNKDTNVKSDIIFIRYDEKGLKNVYLCTHCNTSWKTSDN